MQLISTFNKGFRFLLCVIGIVHKYNNTCHKTIKMKPVDVTSSTFNEFNKEYTKEGSKFKVNDHIRISEYKNIFAKGYVPYPSQL